MKKVKVTTGYLILLALPGAILEALNNIYNNYVPIYIQAGNPIFASENTTLTFGFGLGAMIVGLWMVADNVWGFFGMPIVGAWSDRTRNRRGRRLPFILWALPFVLIGFGSVAVIPTLIPQTLNGEFSKLVPYFIAFTLACVIFYVGFMPSRVITQTLRQEAVDVESRTKVESWWIFLVNLFTIIALTAGSALYKIYGPLLFWVAMGLYVLSVILLAVKYKEAKHLSSQADQQEEKIMTQLASVFKGISSEQRRNLILFLVSVVFFTLAASAYTNFSSSWAVNQLGINEAKAAQFTAIMLIAATIIVLPAGYLAAGKFGRRNVYLIGLVVMLLGLALLAVLPQLYLFWIIIVGFGYGTGFSCQVPLVSELSPKENNLGSLIGVYNVAYLFGFVVGSFLVGWLIDMLSYTTLFPASSIFLFISILTFLFVKVPKKKEETKTTLPKIETAK